MVATEPGRTRFRDQKAGEKRVALYVRVSTEEQVEGYSLDAQDRAGRLYCEAHGWEIAEIYRDEGKSARTDDLARRPAFQQLLADAEAGASMSSSSTSSTASAATCASRSRRWSACSTWGVGFVSISEQMDFTTPIGKVILATLAAFAQYYSDNLSLETKKGKAERKAQGLYNGLLPFGVKKNSAGIPVPDPETYPGLLLAFESAAKGSSDREVAVLLNERGYRTSGNRGRNLFTKDTVRPLLQNRFYLGELPDGAGGWRAGAHEPLLDDALFAGGSGSPGAAGDQSASRQTPGAGLLALRTAAMPLLWRVTTHPPGQRACSRLLLPTPAGTEVRAAFHVP